MLEEAGLNLYLHPSRKQAQKLWSRRNQHVPLWLQDFALLFADATHVCQEEQLRKSGIDRAKLRIEYEVGLADELIPASR